MRKHLQQLKVKHIKFIDDDAIDILNSNNDDKWPYYYSIYLNPQSGADWVRVRDTANRAAQVHKDMVGNRVAKRTAGKAKAVEVWSGPRGQGDFNEL